MVFRHLTDVNKTGGKHFGWRKDIKLLLARILAGIQLHFMTGITNGTAAVALDKERTVLRIVHIVAAKALDLAVIKLGACRLGIGYRPEAPGGVHRVIDIHRMVVAEIAGNKHLA